MTVGCDSRPLPSKERILSVGQALISTKFDRPWSSLVFTVTVAKEIMTASKSYVKFWIFL